MESVGAYEAKTHLGQLLERVSRGESIMITKHGVPVAVLKPAGMENRHEPQEVIKKIRSFRKKHTLGDLSIKEMIEEGRR